jgi:hypothetical protein
MVKLSSWGGERLLIRFPESYEIFARKFKKIRPETRHMVTTLNFSSLHAATAVSQRFFDQENSWTLSPESLRGLWFRRLASLGTGLKFVIVDDLDSFTAEAALLRGPEEDTLWMAERESRRSSSSETDDSAGIVAARAKQSDPRVPLAPHPDFKLLLLSTANCTSLDPEDVLDMPYARSIVYLDISNIRRGRAAFLFKNDPMPNIRILKLRNLGLKAKDIKAILSVLKRRLFCLDLRNNLLDKEAIRVIDKYCFLDPVRKPTLDESQTILRYLDEPPAYHERAHHSEEQETWVSDARPEFRPDDPKGVTKLLQDWIGTNHSFNHRPQDSILCHQTGLTHLYISSNRIKAYDWYGLRNTRIQMLDIGDCLSEEPLENPRVDYFFQPGLAEYLVPKIVPRLESLRVHHSIVTSVPTILGSQGGSLNNPRAIMKMERMFPRKSLETFPYFLPDQLPRLRVLILTSVPESCDMFLINRILEFLRAASEQERIIFDAMPSTSRHSPKMLPGLRQLRLEFHNIHNHVQLSAAGPSVSGDADADNFMAESEKDFSFFDNESNLEEVTDPFRTNRKQPSNDYEMQKAAAVLPIDSTSPEAKSHILEENLVYHDVIESLRKYRSATKAAMQAELERLRSVVPEKEQWRIAVPPGAPHYHWGGKLEVIRT